MDNTQFREKLEDEIQVLKTELESLGVQNKNNPEDWVPTPSEKSDAEADPNDLGDRSEDWQERRGTLDQLETRFNNVKRALQKIEKETFGQCEICNQEIENDRLAVNPAARTCKTHLEDEVSLDN